LFHPGENLSVRASAAGQNLYGYHLGIQTWAIASSVDCAAESASTPTQQNV